MGCKCKQHANGGNAQRASLPKVPAQVIQPSIPQSDLPDFSSGQQSLTEQDAMTAERRRIEKLRREAVRRSLGIG